MKELSIEQKARAYDVLLTKAKQIYNKENDVLIIHTIEDLFPEVRKNEDERIRKALISILKSDFEEDTKIFGISVGKIITWLEKQGNKDSQIKLPTFTFDDILALQCCMETVKKVQNDKDLYEKLNDLHGRVYDAYYLEKQGEQNLIMADSPQLGEQKPKFKVGDWVVFTNGNVEHIVSVGTHGYTFDDGDYLLHDKCDKDAHLWSIQDTKEGDVLVDVYGNIGIFEKRYGINWHTYCYLRNEGRFISEGGSHGSICYPATKSQRGALMKAMTDAGYSFDFEKKELKKVEQEQDSINPSEYINDIGGNGCYLKNTAQVSAWSEEDKSRFVSDLLKSIKQRIGG